METWIKHFNNIPWTCHMMLVYFVCFSLRKSEDNQVCLVLISGLHTVRLQGKSALLLL